MKKIKTRKDQVISAERNKKILALRKAGASYQQISEVVGVTLQRCQQVVAEAMQEYKDETKKNCDGIIALEIARLDRLLMAHWDSALSGRVSSAKIVLSIAERRTKLLGLDSPTKIDANQNITIDEPNKELVAFLDWAKSQRNSENESSINKNKK